MNVCLAQVRSDSGAVEHNIDRHLAALRGVPAGAADLVVFPELSLSNYDPEAAGHAALAPDDHRLAVFQGYADETGTAVAVGAPVAGPGLPVIGLVVFTPGRPPGLVGKTHLHTDEVARFSPFDAAPAVLNIAGCRIGIAICYEISVREHTEAVMALRPSLYLASAAKTARGVADAHATLAATARRYGVPTLLVNSVGTCEGEPAGGGSAVFGRDGRLVRRLGGSREGLLLVDAEREMATEWSVA